MRKRINKNLKKALYKAEMNPEPDTNVYFFLENDDRTVASVVVDRDVYNPKKQQGLIWELSY